VPKCTRIRWKNRRKRLWLSAAVLVGAIVMLTWRHKLQPSHFVVVEPGLLYRSGVLSPRNLEEVLTRYGIRTVVNLRSVDERCEGDWYKTERAICGRAGVGLLDLPVKGDVPADGQIDQWLELLGDRTRHPILIHCAQGVMRTGLMVAVYEMEFHRKSNRQALADMRLFGHNVNTPRHRDLREFILNYKPRWKAGTE
jgi:protein tyrosine/serine phosphatase